MGQPGFFDLSDRLNSLSRLGDNLEALNEVVDWETFRPALKETFAKERKSKAGRKPYDLVLMFKVLVLQALYNLCDDQVEFQIRDRLTFMRFLGLGLEDAVPDAKTVWLFRDHLGERGVVAGLFAAFDETFEAAGYLP